MWLIILVMAISMIGIGVIQLQWFRSSIEQDEKNFDAKVMIALGIVKERLMEDARNTDIVIKKWEDYYKSKGSKSSLLNQIRTYKSIINAAPSKLDRQKLNFDLTSTEMMINPESFLERVDKDKLDKYIKHEMDQQEIVIPYDYGIYSNRAESFLIMNGHYTAQIGSNQNSSPAEVGNALYNSEYQISLFNSSLLSSNGDDEVIPGYLKVYFPTKSRYLWSSVIPSLIMSILFTGLVLFCFGYVIYVIQRQKKVSEMKTDFINNMTHEFKTPIATISLAADSIGSPMILGNQEKVKRFTNIIKQENSRMLNQVEKVLQMAMLDKKDFQLKLSRVDLHELIEQAVEHVNLKIAKRNGILRAELKAENKFITADSTHISNLIHNLLDNAEKYSPEKVDITISTKNKSDGIVLSITDKGLGMTKDQLKNIFEKFFRVHTGNIHDIKGFGLGLSYVKAIVDAHNGKINVKSEPGKGSTFSIFLPSKPNDTPIAK